MAPPSSPDKSPPEEAFASPPVTIEVGTADSMRNFHIRKDVLRFYSGYFAAALDGRFMETEENMCRLPEEDPIIFEMFQHWIHTRTLYESPLEPAALLSYQLIAKLWIFADAQTIPTLQNMQLTPLRESRGSQSLLRFTGFSKP